MSKIEHDVRQPHNVHFALCTLHLALCSLHFALRTRTLALRTLHFALRTSHFALRTSHFALCTLEFALRTSHFPHSHFALRTLHTSHFALCTLHFAPCTSHFALRTLHFLLRTSRFAKSWSHEGTAATVQEILSTCLSTASGEGVYLLCCQPQSFSLSAAAKIFALPSRDLCRPDAWLRVVRKLPPRSRCGYLCSAACAANTTDGEWHQKRKG